MELWSSSFSGKTITSKTLAMNAAIDELREAAADLRTASEGKESGGELKSDAAEWGPGVGAKLRSAVRVRSSAPPHWATASGGSLGWPEVGRLRAVASGALVAGRSRSPFAMPRPSHYRELQGAHVVASRPPCSQAASSVLAATKRWTKSSVSRLRKWPTRRA